MYKLLLSYSMSTLLEVRSSPTKPCGKGSKRKQDDMDEDDEAEQQSWVEALTQDLSEEDPAVDPDYEVCCLLSRLLTSRFCHWCRVHVVIGFIVVCRRSEV